MTLKELILKYPKLRFIQNSARFQTLSPRMKEYVIGLIEDAMFWLDLEEKPGTDDGFKFLAASYGLTSAQEEAKTKNLTGKEKEKHVRPHQDLYTMFNPYSGNANDSKKK